eukprot:g4225.t1
MTNLPTPFVEFRNESNTEAKLIPRKRRIPSAAALLYCVSSPFTTGRLTATSHPGRGGMKGQYSWSDLPENVLRLICLKLGASRSHWDPRKSLYAISGVCKSWRTVALPLILHGLWETSTQLDTSDLAQLFRINPNEESSFMKCAIYREEAPGPLGTMFVRFSLFLEAETEDSNQKFLLSAIQHNRQQISIHLNPMGTGTPCAKLFSNVLGTTHKLMKCPDTLFPSEALLEQADSIIPTTGSIASVKYKLRMKGMMRPRKLSVSLPLPYENPETNICSKSEIKIRRNQILSTKLLLGKTRSKSERQIKPRSFLQRSSNQKKSPPVPQMQLVNKQPHWNDALKCWCLNFRGRVKLASVKNFQLTCPSDGTGKVVMQFGKVCANGFIMDFNPSKISAIQAFAIALTSFEGRVLL